MGTRASGSRWQPSFVPETSLGVPSGTAFTKARLLLSSAGISQKRKNIQSQQATSDRSVSPGRLGNKTNDFKTSGEFSYGTFKDFIASAFMSSWVAAGTPVSGLSVTVVAGTTNTMAATGIDAGLAVGDWIKTTGFDTPSLSNNGFFKVTAVASGVITLGEAKNPETGVSLLTACTADIGVTVTKMGYIVTGSTEKSLAFEDGMTDLSIYWEALGCVANTMTLGIALDGLVTCGFDFVAKNIVGPSATAYALSYNNPTTTLPMRDVDCVLSQDGVPVATVTKLDLSLNNSRKPQFSVGLPEASGIAYGQSNLTGTMSLYVEGSSHWTKYSSETRFALGLKLMDSGGITGYAIDVPRCFITDDTFQKSLTDSIQNVPFQVEKDTVTGLINWRIWDLA